MCATWMRPLCANFILEFSYKFIIGYEITLSEHHTHCDKWVLSVNTFIHSFKLYFQNIVHLPFCWGKMLKQMGYRVNRYNLEYLVTLYMHQHVEYFGDSAAQTSYITFD